VRACYQQAIVRSGESVNERAKIVSNTTGMNHGSARHYIKAVEQMLDNGHYNMTMNPQGTALILGWIGRDFGNDAQKIAVQVVLRHVDYYKSLATGGPQYDVRAVAEKVLISLSDPMSSSAFEQVRGEFQSTVDKALADSTTARHARLKKADPNAGIYLAIRVVHRRNPDVVAERLALACGYCEICELPAPFNTNAGRPFLEVHHKKPLAEGGKDTVENTVALCPNCHSEAHFGIDRDKFRK